MDKKKRSEELRSFWQRWNRAIEYLSDDLYMGYGEDDDGNMVIVYLAEKENFPHTPLQLWIEVPELVSLGAASRCIAIWPKFPKVTAYTMTCGIVNLLNQHAVIPGQEWIADSICSASPKVTQSGQ